MLSFMLYCMHSCSDWCSLNPSSLIAIVLLIINIVLILDNILIPYNIKYHHNKKFNSLDDARNARKTMFINKTRISSCGVRCKYLCRRHRLIFSTQSTVKCHISLYFKSLQILNIPICTTTCSLRRGLII